MWNSPSFFGVNISKLQLSQHHMTHRATLLRLRSAHDPEDPLVRPALIKQKNKQSKHKILNMVLSCGHGTVWERLIVHNHHREKGSNKCAVHQFEI
jgi:hypothetical protein